MTVGTVPWAAQTKGLLRPRDRLRLVGQLRTRVPLLPGEAVARWGPRRAALRATGSPPQDPPPGPPAGTVSAGIPPSTPIEDEARERCAAASRRAPWLLPHSVRAFRFGELFAARGPIAYDAELLWVAAMFHDFGLVDASASSAACFAIRSADRAVRLAEQHGWPADRCDRLAEAICLHINVSVPAAQNAEGYLLNAGSALDVTGLRFRAIAAAARRRVVAESPRADFSTVVWSVWKAECQRKPGCRAGFLRWTGMHALIASSPWRRFPGG